MQFAYPHILLGLFGLAPIALFLVYTFKRKKALLRRFGDAAIVEKLSRNVNRKAQVYKATCLLLGLGFLIFSLARPQYGTTERPIVRKGVDIFVALDTSRSMLVKDMDPNRFEAARRQINTLIRRLEGDRVGIIAFAGEAFIACPLTLDYGTAMTILDSLDINSVPVKGTAVGRAIEKAGEAFKRTEKGSKVLVVVTDGEDQGTEPIDAAKAAARDGMKIYAIGLGSQGGGPIPLPEGGYKKDKQGSVVNSMVDFDTLQRVAFASGGQAVLTTDPTGERAIEAIYAEIKKLQESLLQAKTYSVYEDRFQYFLLIGLILLLLETVISERRKVKKTGGGRFE